MEEFDFSGFQTVHLEVKNILRERRIILGLTQKQVAERAKITFQSYQRFESGERNIRTASFQLACRVIEALQMDISAFYHGEYVFGEEVCSSEDGLKYVKTGKLVNEDVDEDSVTDK